MTGLNCTCAPSERFEPCQRRYAYIECKVSWQSARITELERELVEAKGIVRRQADEFAHIVGQLSTITAERDEANKTRDALIKAYDIAQNRFNGDFNKARDNEVKWHNAAMIAGVVVRVDGSLIFTHNERFAELVAERDAAIEALNLTAQERPRAETSIHGAAYRCQHCHYRWLIDGIEEHSPRCAFVRACSIVAKSEEGKS